MTFALTEKEIQIRSLQSKIDSISVQNQLSRQIYRELKTQYPSIQSCIVQKSILNLNDSQRYIWMAILMSDKKLSDEQKTKINNWLKVRMNIQNINTYFEYTF